MRGGWGSSGAPTMRNQGLQPAPEKASLRALGKGSAFLPPPTPSYGLTLDWDRDPCIPRLGCLQGARVSREEPDTQLPTLS